MKSVIIILSAISVQCIAIAILCAKRNNLERKFIKELMHDATTWACRCYKFAEERNSIRKKYNALLEEYCAILSEAQELKSYRTTHNYVEVCEREHNFVTKLINER